MAGCVHVMRSSLDLVGNNQFSSSRYSLYSWPGGTDFLFVMHDTIPYHT